MDLAIKHKAEELAYGACSNREISEHISNFVRDQIYYSLDEWDVKPIEVLKKRQGMCAGKALLAAELHRAVGIPARLRVIKILGEEGLFDFVKRQLEEGEYLYISNKVRKRLIQIIHSLPPDRDHITLEVLLDGKWINVDLGRDKELDDGMKILGIWKDRKVISEEGIFDSLDKWLEERMQRRTVLQDRKLFFRVVNEQIEKLRILGRRAKESD
jgi:transglutaminase-like putative cysteine protease